MNTDANPNLSLGLYDDPDAHFMCRHCGELFIVLPAAKACEDVRFCPFCGDDDIEQAEASQP